MKFKNLAPDICRQRLIVEGHYPPASKVTPKKIQTYFRQVTRLLDLKIYDTPIIHATSGKGKPINEGFDAFAPLVDSGISTYVWTNANFLSVIIFTCKKFEEEKAVEFTKSYFEMVDLVWKSF